MRPKNVPLALLVSLCLAALAAVATGRTETASTGGKDGPRVGLEIVDAAGKSKGSCPLKQTHVRAEVSGFLSRVTVTQEFENPLKEKIEAVYTFPLPQLAAVDDMTMLVGDRTVRGKILRREEAQAVYESAKSAGNVASLLDQERPNIFTQSVANIMPGEKVKITISYVETLKYEDGTYEFTFPTVVGPRYVPGGATGQKGNGFAPDTDRVPDASRITPKPAPEGSTAGHDLSLEVALDAGVPVDSLRSTTHEIEVDKSSASAARVRLKDLSARPNKDFILRYDVAGRKITDAVLTHRGERGGFFTMILQPPERVAPADVMPKELVFVLDTSGSMSGFPIEKAKESMGYALEGLYPQDTFNLITFSGDTHVLFPEPVPATPENMAKAKKFLETREGGGVTEMMKAIKAALDPSDSQSHVRIVCFMTDGYVGNDMEIIGEIQKHPNARVFSFGIGSSTNRYLLDKMAEEGRGEVEYVALDDDGSAAARRFHERVRNPLLTDISIDWAGLPVADVYPRRIPDLFSTKPVTVTGRFTGGGQGTIRLKGRMAGNHFEREIPITLPESQPAHDVLATLWARTRVDDLMREDYQGVQQGNARPDLREAITSLGIEYRLMTQFTSFVAVEEMIVTDGGQPRRIDVPVEMPEGVSRADVFGGREERKMFKNVQGLVSFSAGATTVISARGSQATLNAPVASMESVTTRRIKKLPPQPRKSKAIKDGGAGSGGGSGVGPGRGSNTSGGDRRAGGVGGGTGAGGVVVSGAVNEISSDDAVLTDGTGAQTPEARKRLELQSKLHPFVFAVVERLNKKETTPGADEAKFVRDGKAELQIWLTEKSEEAIAQLKALGFEVVLDPKTSKVVIGRLPVEKLAALAELKTVRYVSPQMPIGK